MDMNTHIYRLQSSTDSVRDWLGTYTAAADIAAEQTGAVVQPG